MKTLLIADGSPQSERALRFGALVASRTERLPTILAVLDKPGADDGTDAETILARARELVGVPNAHARVRRGEAFEQILQEAAEGAYDLVIMADCRPRSLLARLYYDSTAIRVAECAPCSVIVVRGRVERIQRILLCDSGFGSSSLLSRLVIELTNLLEGEEDVTVLHVMSQISAGPGVTGRHLRAGADELIEERTLEGEILERDLLALRKPGIHPIPIVRHGLVVDEILDEARSGNYDLVVVGAHPATGSKRFLLDNIAHQVMKRISRPTLVVREKAGSG